MKYYGLIIPPVFPTGVFIQDVKQTAKSDESEGVNTMTVTLTNQQKAQFSVKNGKQGSTAEATAQMEKHAKEYITAELTEQKLKLEQAIENGRIEINNLVAQASDTLEQEAITLIKKKESILDDKINTFVKHINNKLSEAIREIQEYSFNDDFGWIKFQNELIIQFFKIESKSRNYNRAYFPIPFPNNVLTVTSSLITENRIDDPHIALTLYIWDKTKEGFSFSCALSGSGVWAQADYDIIAIGY